MFTDKDVRAARSSFLTLHAYPGRLIAAEGLDGSGKSTQLRLLSFWLRAEGYEVVVTEWSPSRLIKRALKKGKKQGHMDSALLSILYAADLTELYEKNILPPLRRGAVVLVDRYVYTALTRDMARGVERDWVEQVYRFAVQPDLTIYFQISAEESLRRTLLDQEDVNYYQAGMDLGLSSDPIASFRAFQERILAAYESILAPLSVLRLNASLPVKAQQRILREAVESVLPGEEW